MRRLFPLARGLAGPAFRETLDALSEVAGPMTRHRWSSGEQVLDWIVPDEWLVRDGWVRGPDGIKVIDFADSSLHVVSYSAPVHERMTLDELQGHLHSLPSQPDAVPYLTSYYARDWGFCLADDVRRGLSPGPYEVCIDSELYPGHLEVGEVVIPGTGAGEVMFSTYCCHPSLANNELSGPVVAAHLAASLRAHLTPPRLTYRFLFVPETIGAIAYLSRFGDDLRRRLIAGYVITCVGDPGPFTYKRSRRGDSLADRVAEHVLRHAGGPHRVVDFFPWGSDERQYCSPGFDLPVGSLMRSMYATYPEYHTSLDDLEFVTPEALQGSLARYAEIVEALEANRTLLNTAPFGEPQLGKRGLYPSLGGQRRSPEELNDVRWLLNLCDGTRDLLDVAERTQRPIAALARASRALTDAGLLVVKE